MQNDIRYLTMSGYVGFESLPQKYVVKRMEDGFVFNILCIGETGIGKTTLMNSLFKTTFDRDHQDIYDSRQTSVKSNTYHIKEGNVHLKLTVCSTLCYGDDMNKQNSLKPIVDYIDKQHEFYFQQEMNMKHPIENIEDTRIHVCLYFVCPSGHNLKPLDLVCMKKIADKVNIVPVIAKSDTVYRNELQTFKEGILKELTQNGVQIYSCPIDEPTVEDVNTVFNSLIPFAIIGSTDVVKIGEQTMRARQYPWGIVEIENEGHCDLIKLREMLLQINTVDLREKTHCLHYELFRKKHLENMGFSDFGSDNIPITFQQMLIDRRVRLDQEFTHGEANMKWRFEVRMEYVKDDLDREEKDMMDRMQIIEENLAEKRRALDLSRKKLDEEIVNFKKRVAQKRKTSSSYNLLFSLGKKN